MEFIRKNKKSILEILFLVLLVVFTFYALLKDQELGEINQVLKTASPGWLIAALVLVIVFVCSETDAARIQKCLWHGFFDYCEGGFNGEQQVNDWQKSILILHNALVAAKEGSAETPVEISVRDAYWILSLMKKVETMSEGLAEEGSFKFPDRAEQMRTNLKRCLQQLEKCKKDCTVEEINDVKEA